MLLPKIILIFYLFKNCYCDVSKSSQLDMASHTLPKKLSDVEKLIKNSTQDANKKTPGIRFRLPFMDMELENHRNVHIMQERLHKQRIYVLHGNELYEMFIGRNEKRLALIGFLNGGLRENELLGAEIIDLRDYLIMVIALEEYLEVYQLSEKILESRAQATKDPKRINETAPIFEPIQQISLSGRYRQHFLTDPSKETIMLIVGINYTKLYGRLNTFVWTGSYFERIEELTVAPTHKLYIMGTYPKYLVRGRAIKHQEKTIITVAEIQSSTMRLHTIQTLTVNSHTVHAGSFHGKHHLIACSNKQKQCNSFRMTADSSQFNVYKKRLSKDLAFDKFTGGQHFLVAARQNQIMVFTSGRLDCYSSFKTNESDVASILTLVNAHGEDFILLKYKLSPFQTLIRMVELESENGGLLGAAPLNATDIEDTSALLQHRHKFEEIVGALRSLLLRRRLAMTAFYKIAKIPKPTDLNLSQPVRIHSGEINSIKLVGHDLSSPVQLLQRAAKLRRSFFNGRFKRDVTTYANSTGFRVKNLIVRNLKYEDSVLPGFHLDRFAKPQPILSVRPKLTTKIMIAEKFLPHHKLRRAREDKNLTYEELKNIGKFKHLNVVNINGVSWQEFYDSLFLKNRDDTMKGRLTLQAAANVTNLTTVTLNGLVTRDLFNLREPQLVTSNIIFSGLLIKNLTAESVNGLDFANDIVFQNTESFIETPVNMYHLSIEKDLLLSDNVTIQRAPIDEEREFKQHYTGRVIINGTLTVKNLLQEQTAPTRLLVDGKPFSYEKIKQKYLLHDEPQHFNSRVIFGNAKVTIPSLKTRFLNDNPVEAHLLVNQDPATHSPLFIIFLNAHIEGDLIMEKGLTRIANLSRNLVRRHDVANITGTKIFEGPLSVNDVMTLTLNEMPVSELVLKSQLKRGLRFSGPKSFNSVDVEDVLTVNKVLNASHLNKMPLNDILGTDFHFERLELPQLRKAKNVVFKRINGHNFNEVFESFKMRNDELYLHKKLLIEGNLKFGKNLNVTNINDLNWQSYLDDLVRVNENAKINGLKCFQQELTLTKTLDTSTINNMALEKIFERVLFKSRPQNIEGSYSFGNVQFSNLDVPMVNDVPASEFIDLRAENVTLYGDVVVPKLTVLGDIKSKDVVLQELLQNLTNKISQLSAQKWRNIFVIGNAYWNDSQIGVPNAQHELLSYIYKNAVQTNGQQVISGNVKFNAPVIAKMSTKTAFPKNFDLDFIAKDSLLRNAERTQTISGKKVFLMPLQLHNVKVNDYLGTHLLNGIEVLRFNASLYRLSSKMPVVGPLKFRTPATIGKLNVAGFINGINPAMLYHNASEPLPPLQIRMLMVNKSLQIDEINGESLDYLLEQRLTKNDALPQEITGTLNFQHLILNKNNMLQSINGIPVENLVFKRSKQLQSITGTKTFEQDLQLKGPVHVLRLNGQDITERYQQTVFKNRDYELGSLKAQSAAFEKGFILLKNVASVETIVGSALALTSPKELATSIQQELQIIKVELDKQSDAPKNLLYLDVASNWKISCTAPQNVSINKSYQLPSKRTALCKRQFQNVQISYPANETTPGHIFLSNFSSNVITASAYNISVKAVNFCQHEYRKVKSKITIITSEFMRVIGLKKYTEHILIYKPVHDGDILLLLHELEFAHNRHEVRILRLPKSAQQNITDWQSLSFGIGKSVRLFSFPNHTALISGGCIIENRPSLAVYHFNTTTALFQLFQSIAGDFDIYELIPTEASSEFQLLLSCNQCRQIHIYTYNSQINDSAYELLQVIKLKTRIERIQPFTLGDGSLYALFLGEHDEQFYYLYRYTQLQGWLQSTYGYFENTELVVPLIDHDLSINEHNLLILVCGSTTCKLIKAVIV